MGEEPRGRYGYVPSPLLLLNPPARCRHHTAMPFPAPLPLAKQQSQTPAAFPQLHPHCGAGEGQKKETTTGEKGQGCLVYSPHLPGKGSSTHRRPPASRICIHRAAFEQGTHCTTGGKNCQEMQTTIAEWERIPALRDLSLSTSPLRNSSYDHTGHNNYSSYIFLTVGL